MRLLTADIRRRLPALYATDGAADRTVVAKFFCPWNHWTWYVLEGDRVPADGGEPEDWRFFGLVDGHEVELGYFSLNELASVRGPLGLGIERDRHFAPVTLAELTATLDARWRA